MSNSTKKMNRKNWNHDDQKQEKRDKLYIEKLKVNLTSGDKRNGMKGGREIS